MSRKKKDFEKLIDGVRLSNESCQMTENRVFTLLTKGFITYLICAGTIGSAVTSTGTLINHLALNVCCLLFSIIISFIYYNKLSENIGDILYFLVAGFIGVFFSRYINSGFYSWMNDLLGSAGAYFNINEIGGYNASAGNAYQAATVAACYLSSIAVMLIYITVVKKMKFVDLVLDCAIVMILPIYLELEPNYAYFGMVLCGLTFCYIWNTCGVKNKTNDNNVYSLNKKGITYVYNIKAVLQSFAMVLLAVVLIMLVIYAVFPKDDYIIGRERSNMKKYTDDTVSNVMTSGIGAFFNRYESTGGLSTGRLGGINSISMDYMTDLYVTYAPYNYNAVYIRNFIAGDYIPYADLWNRADNQYIYEDEYNYLKRDYGKNMFSSKGMMVIENVDSPSAVYSPYYSSVSDSLRRGETAEITYYNRLNSSLSDKKMRKMSDEEYEYWTRVPEDNIAAIERFIERLNIDDSLSELEKAMAIKIYYEENVPYTLRPGATPRRRDFVNYFLDNNRKGYCAHFAAAGTLILRYMGIPARYVEGYCFDYENMLNASIVNDDYDKYYEGYNELNDRGVIKVNITDADAHAWVEIFIDGYGWTSIELTPPSSDTQMSTGNLFSRLISMLDTDNSNVADSANVEVAKINTKRLRIVLVIVVLSIISFVVIYTLQITIKNIIRYRKAAINDRLIIRYHNYLRKCRRKYPVNEAINYREQIEMLISEENDRERLIAILEKAGFSNELISDEEFEYVTGKLK